MAFDEEPHSRHRGRARRGLDSGESIDRILALSDGVFAFALTLLVINLVVPTDAALNAASSSPNQNVQLAAYLWNIHEAFIAYGLSFFIIGSWWIVHHRIFQWVKHFDRILMGTNLVFLLFIAITPFDVGLLANYLGTSLAVAFYAAAQALAGLVVVLLLLYLQGPGRHLMDPEVTDPVLKRGTHLALITPTGFAVSIPIALLNPIAGIVSWAGIFLGRAAIVRRFPEPAPPLAT